MLSLMSACGGASTAIINGANTESAAHESATAEFEGAISQLEELGCSYEISTDGVHFSRGPAVEEYDPSSRIAAAPFLGLEGPVELGTLCRIVDVSAHRRLKRCPVLICPKTLPTNKLCSNPCKFHARQGAALLRSA
jgi:hypothetical protein